MLNHKDKNPNDNKSKIILTQDECKPNSNAANYYKQVLVLNSETLKEEYREAKYQLWLAYIRTFGCDPDLRGQRLQVVCLADGETASMLRSDFLGVCKKEIIPEYIHDNRILDNYMKDASTEEQDNMEECL